MAGGIGSLTVSLGLDAAEYTNGLTKAQQQAQQFADSVKGIAIGTAIGDAFSSIATRVFEGLHSMTLGAIDAADHLNDLSKKTGIAVDTLGGIGFAAGQAGGNIETASAAAGKLNKSLAEASAGNKDAAEAFKLLGISVKDASGQTIGADAALVQIAEKFSNYADGPEKAALALRIFGKAGADIIPLLDDGGASLQQNIDYFKQYSAVSQETATAADQFNDTLGKVHLLSGALGTTIAASLLPSFQAVADQFLAMKESGNSFAAIADTVKAVFDALVIGAANVVFTFVGVGREIGAVAAQLNALAHGDIQGFSAIGDAVKADGAQARRELDSFTAQYKAQVSAVANYSHEGKNVPVQPKQTAPALAAKGAGDQTASILKKQLDGQIKLIDDFGKQQADAYKFAQSYLDGVYQDGLVSQQEFFDGQKRVRDAGLANTVATLDKDIAAYQAYLANPAIKPAEREATEAKIKLAVQQRSEAVTKANQADTVSAQDNARAARQLADQYDDLRASVMANSNNELGAAQIKIAQQFRDAQKLVTQAGGDSGLADTYKQQLTLQAQAAQQQRDYTKLLDDSQRKEAEIYADAQINGKGELETLAAIGAARQVAIGQLQQQAQAAAALAQQSGTDADAKRAADLALAVKQAEAQIDPLKAKFDGIFEDSFSNAFAGFITGSQTASQAFKSFTSSVIGEIAKIAAQNLAKAIFGGGDSSSSGLLGLLGTAASLFGGSYNANYSHEGLHLATGTNYVPYDGFQATLHRGEAVVPAKYNPANGASASTSGAITIVNQTSAAIGRVTETKLSNGDRALLIEEASTTAAEKIAAQHYDPNSRVSKALDRNYTASRRR